MKELERRLGKLESVRAAEADHQLIFVDETLPDGTMIHNGQPVVVRPAKHTLIVHWRPKES